MNFVLPNTKEEMYSTLQDIFHYYRTRREEWENIDLAPLELDRLDYRTSTAMELATNANKAVVANHLREILKLKEDLEMQIAVKKAEKTSKENSLEEAVSKITKSYTSAKNEYQTWADARGMISSELVVKQLSEYETKKTAEVNNLNSQFNAEIQALGAQITLLEQRLANANNVFNSIHEKERIAKEMESSLEEQKIAREVFKYNNALTEEELKYSNKLIETKANLEVKYLQINSNFFTKDQLVDMGYYSDAIKCVCGYYDTLNALTAFQDISAEQKLCVYLDDFYNSVVYGYKCQAGL